MKKHIYRAKNVNQINWHQLKERLANKPIAFAIDLAKEKQFAVLENKDAAVSELLHWKHPGGTWMLLEALKSLDCPVVVIMESTSTYGDAMRYQFKKLGFSVHQASAKRVHDAAEVYDGVPSSHDAKAATTIARFYNDGLTKPWPEQTEEEVLLLSLRLEFDMHHSQYQRNENRLEAYLSRYWPEVTYLLELNSVTLESLLIKYGSAEEVAANAEEAARDMRRIGRSQLSKEKIEQVVRCAKTTIGRPCQEPERRYLMALAKEMEHSRLQRRSAKKALEAVVDHDEALSEPARLIGRVTLAVLISCHLDPRKFDCARSFQKAMGLNLKEKSSGRFKGQLKLTKRGSSLARKYLYFAALRLIRNDPVVKTWYLAKVNPHIKNKTVIELMRKLSKALWHVARGQKFDANMLFSQPKQATQ